MNLRKLLENINYELVSGSLDVEIIDLVYDSRCADSGKAFFAISGFKVDGHDYIDNAIENGCKVIFVEKDVSVNDNITVIKLDDTRRGLSIISRVFFGYPDKEITTIGITGTKGKTTTSWIVSRILNNDNKKCGIIGTMGVFYDDKYYHTVNTTPEAYDVFKYMREMIDNGVKYLAMEISSQSLKLKRWEGIIFDYAIFTNMSLDHVGGDEHSDYDDYVNCKSRLFKQTKHGIYNIDDKEYVKMINGTSGDITSYGTSDSADYKLVSVNGVNKAGFLGISMKVSGKINDEYLVSIPGDFSAMNALGAIVVAKMIGVSDDIIHDTLKNVSVKGRMEPVKVSNKFHLIIDYAYQGIALSSMIKTIRETNPGARIVSVFGCGGNRSRQRRYDMGKISGEMSDFTIVTSDNPRYEDPIAIIDDILLELKKTEGEYVVIPDRKDAIKYAICNAKEGDVILLLGKGHEDYQEINGVRYPFDERVIIKEVIDNMSDDERAKL